MGNTFPSTRQIPRIFLFDACDGHASWEVDTSAVEEVVESQLPVSKDIDLSIVNELQNTQTSLAEIEKSVTIRQWKGDMVNPDHNLMVIHGSNRDFVAKAHSEYGSFLTKVFAEAVMMNIRNGDVEGLDLILPRVQNVLEEEKVQLPKVESFNNAMNVRLQRHM